MEEEEREVSVSSKDTSSSCSWPIILTFAIFIIAIILLFCDQHSTKWLKYFDEWADNARIPL